MEEKKPEATRKSSQNSIEILSQSIKNFLGGSADLTESNLTKVKTSKVSGKKINYIHYGIREHLMAAAMNGISLHGGFIPYGGTFLIFSDYCKNAIRLSALMKQQVIYVFTHDSIGLGEDGPTHQPVEQLVGLRAIPNLLVLRPCDSIETFECWELALINNDKPSCLILSRQGLPLIRNDFKTNKCQKGAYFIKENKNSKITLFASGSELSLALKIYQLLKKKKINSNLVSMPSIELFESQSQFYKNKILGKNPRVFIEASTSMNWYKFKEKNDTIIGIDTFGESGKGNDVLKHFGFDENLILNKILKDLKMMINLRKSFLDSLEFVNNKTAILRIDLNLPIFDGKVSDFTRMDKITPTIKGILNRNGKIIIISHLGRPKGINNKELSLKQLVPFLEEKIESKITFCNEDILEKKLKE